MTAPLFTMSHIFLLVVLRFDFVRTKPLVWGWGCLLGRGCARVEPALPEHPGARLLPHRRGLWSDGQRGLHLYPHPALIQRDVPQTPHLPLCIRLHLHQ